MHDWNILPTEFAFDDLKQRNPQHIPDFITSDERFFSAVWSTR